MISACGPRYGAPMRTRLIAPALAIILAAGCGTDTSSGAPTTTSPSGVAKAPVKARHLDAGGVLAKLKADKLGLTNTAVQDEDNDPNNLIGRPGEYTSRASADLPGGDQSAPKGDTERGLVIEVFATAADATKRGTYITSVKTGILGTEWEYYTADGTGLVRVGGSVKPSLAKKIQAAVARSS